MVSCPQKLLLKNCLLSKSSYKLNYFPTKSCDLFRTSKCISRRNISTTRKFFSRNIRYDIPHRVLFFGTDDFALTCLEKIRACCSKPENLEVVTIASKHSSRSPVLKYSHANKVPVHLWPMLPDSLSSQFDIGVVVSFGVLLPSKLINAFPLKMINVHGSLLPQLRGAAPIARAIEQGMTETGVSIIELSPGKFDHGKILARSSPVTIGPSENADVVTDRLAHVGADLCCYVLSDYNSRLSEAVVQSNTDATYAPKLTLDDTYVNFQQLTATDVFNKFRALGYAKKYYLRCYFNKQLVRFADLKLCEETDVPLLSPGQVIYNKKQKSLIIGCKNDSAVTCRKLILKKALSATDFYNGQMQSRLKRGEIIILKSEST